MSDDISKDHSRRAMKYIEEMSNKDITYDQILRMYKEYRKDGYDRNKSLYWAVEYFLFDKLVDSEGQSYDSEITEELIQSAVDPNNIEINEIKYGSFPYKLLLLYEPIGYTYMVIRKNSNGAYSQVEAEFTDRGKITFLEMAVPAFIKTIVSYAISNTRTR